MAIASLIGGVLAAIMTMPLVWKWQLGYRRVASGLLVIVLAASAIGYGVARAIGLSWAGAAFLGAGLTLTTAFVVLAWRFYRDPDRRAPLDEGVVVSPADGEVVYVKYSQGGRLPVSTKHGRHVALSELTRTDMHDEDSVVIGIGMSFLDVHINRSPISGRVVLRRHFPGRFGSLANPEMVLENERATTVIAGPELQVAVVQIASRLVRQIAGFVGESQDVSIGDRIGVIRLGSQVDLILPARPDLRVLVSEGDRVRAGTSVVAALGSGLEQPPDPALAAYSI